MAGFDRAPRTTLALAVTASLAGCGSGSKPPPARTENKPATALVRTSPIRHFPVTLHASQIFALPAPRSGAAAAAFGANVILSGGLSSAGVSTATVFELGRRGVAALGAGLPTPVHDGAAAELSGRLLVFGGGPSGGSDRIVQVLPAPARVIGRLPQALSDLAAVTIGDVAYVVGGFNGSVTNREIYGVRSDGTVTRVGSIPAGVRYPAAAALGGRVIIAGGERASGNPTAAAWSFDPVTRRVQRIADLPIPTDHTAGAVLGRRFYVIGGLRRGALTDAILSWTPGQSRWRGAGHIPAALSDLSAAPFGRGIALLGGRGGSGAVPSVTVMTP